MLGIRELPTHSNDYLFFVKNVDREAEEEQAERENMTIFVPETPPNVSHWEELSLCISM